MNQAAIVLRSNKNVNRNEVIPGNGIPSRKGIACATFTIDWAKLVTDWCGSQQAR
jgi:hypothetical protein